MKRVCLFISITLTIMMIELFYWGDLLRNPEDPAMNITVEAIASSNGDEDQFSMTTTTGTDPTSLILLGSGLIGLIGIGIKKKKRID
jgi:LPXTG-motif cell wall-anchored protein